MRLGVLSVSFFLPALAWTATQHGEWTLGRSDEIEKVSLSLRYSNGANHNAHESSDWNKNDFRGFDFSQTGRHDVRFSIDREAGVLTGYGFVEGYEGAGLFDFTSHPEFTRQMAALGFADFTGDKLFVAMQHNVTSSFAREIKAQGILGLDADKLIAFRIFDVTSSFIKSLRAAGVAIADADKLIAFRIHGVSPEFVGSVEKLGFANPGADKLIALRIHGVTPEYIQSLRSHGLRDLTLDQAIALRIQGIN